MCHLEINSVLILKVKNTLNDHASILIVECKKEEGKKWVVYLGDILDKSDLV